jgi:hypothetical protein
MIGEPRPSWRLGYERWWPARRYGRTPQYRMWAEREPVANDEHLAVLRQGFEVWNKWRRRNRGETPDLSGANLDGSNLERADLRRANLNTASLSGANLNGANLRQAKLSGTDLRKANLEGMDLSGANLRGSDLRRAELAGVWIHRGNLKGANLSEADLQSAKLTWTDLSGANLRGTWLQFAEITCTNLRGADLNGAYLFNTMLNSLDLKETIGLEHCEHIGPSIIDLNTLLTSPLPTSFLRGCGVPEKVIEYLPSMRDDANQFHSCFISYSSRDQAFAERLHADLQNKGVRCWFAPPDLPIGAKTWDAIDEAIRLRDKLLLILSKASIASEWVEDEVNKAYAEERSRKEIVLFPICIDDAVMSTGEPWAVKLRDQRNIGNFRQWNEPAEYRKSLDRLLRDLKASATK